MHVVGFDTVWHLDLGCWFEVGVFGVLLCVWKWTLVIRDHLLKRYTLGLRLVAWWGETWINLGLRPTVQLQRFPCWFNSNICSFLVEVSHVRYRLLTFFPLVLLHLPSRCFSKHFPDILGVSFSVIRKWARRHIILRHILIPSRSTILVIIPVENLTHPPVHSLIYPTISIRIKTCLSVRERIRVLTHRRTQLINDLLISRLLISSLLLIQHQRAYTLTRLKVIISSII